MSRPYSVIAIPDMQVPYQAEHAVVAVLDYLKTHRIDEVILMGDFLDMYPIASFNKNAMKKVEGKTVQKEYDEGNKMLDRIESAARNLNKRCKFTYLVGNHEHRIQRYIDEFPQLDGILNLEKGLRLKERGHKVVWCYPDGEAHTIGNAVFIHGLYTSANHAKKHVDNFGCNIFYGHTHDAICHSKVLWGKGKAVVGQSLGCLCRYDLDYVGQNPKNWSHNFGIFFFFDDGDFTYYVPRIIYGRFLGPDGKQYGKCIKKRSD